MEYSYYKIIYTDKENYLENTIIWDYDRLIETIEKLEREGRKFTVKKYTERTEYNA